MTVPVIYGNEMDKEPAERVSNAIQERSDFSSFATEAASVDFASFDGVVLVGGSKASQPYENVTELTSLQDPTQSNYIVIQSVAVEGTPVLGVAGHTDENTETAVDQVLSNGSLEQFLGISGDSREDAYDDGDDSTDDTDYGSGDSQGDRITLGYSGAFGVVDTVLGVSASHLQGVINNSPFTSRTGYTISDIEVDKQNNEVDFYVDEVGSVSLLTAGLILAGLLTANVLGLSWFAKNAKEEETDQEVIEEKKNTREALQEIINDENADEETKEAARQTLTELGADVGDDTGDDSGSGNGFFAGLPISKRDLLIIAGGILLLDEFTSGRSRVRTIVRER